MDKPTAPPRRFKTRPGIQRKSAEERAAIRAESLRQNQLNAQPTPAPPVKTEKRATFATAESRFTEQNTKSVFGSASSRPAKIKTSTALTGTEELVERREGEELADEAETSRPGQSSSKVKAKAKAKKSAPRVTKKASAEGETALLSDNEEHGMLRDIDEIQLINISSDEGGDRGEDEDDVNISKIRKHLRTPDPTMGLRPVRAARDPVSFDESGALQSWGQRRADRPKSSLVERGENIDLTQEEDPSAPAAAHDDAPPKPPSPVKKRRKSSTRDTKPSFETFEDRREKEIIVADLQTMKSELCPPLPSALPTYKGKSTASTPLEPPKLYLFQFPPLTPMLVGHDPDQITEPPGPSATELPAEPIDVDAPAASTDKTQPPPPPPAPTVLNASNNPPLPNGLAGRMNVHQSGRVTIEWGCGNPATYDDTEMHSEDADGDIDLTGPGEKGGVRAGPGITNFDVNLGMEVDFLQDVVVLDGGGVRVKNEGEGEGVHGAQEVKEDAVDAEREAFALGQVRMKFVVVPDWEKIFE